MTATIGLEIDARSVRLTALCGRGKRQKIRHGAVELPVGAITGGTIQQVDAVTDALTSWRKSMKLKGGQVVAVLSGDVVSNRIITLPSMSPEQIASALAWSDAVPLSGQPGLVRSHWNLGPGADKKIRVLAAAVGEDTATRLAEAVFLAGFELTALEIAPLSVWRLLKKGWLRPAPDKDHEAGFAVLTVGEEGGDWMVFRHHQLWEWAHFNLKSNIGLNQNQGKYNVHADRSGTEDKRKGIHDPDDEWIELISIGEKNSRQFRAECQENNRLSNEDSKAGIHQWLRDRVAGQPTGQPSEQPSEKPSGEPLEQLSGQLAGQHTVQLGQLLLIGSRAAEPGLAGAIQENLSLPVSVGGPMDAAAALAAGASLRGEF